MSKNKLRTFDELSCYGMSELIEEVQKLEKKLLSLQESIPFDEIWNLCDYDYADEEKHYEENDKPAGHIVLSIRKVGDWVIKNKPKEKKYGKTK